MKFFCKISLGKMFAFLRLLLLCLHVLHVKATVTASTSTSALRNATETEAVNSTAAAWPTNQPTDYELHTKLQSNPTVANASAAYAETSARIADDDDTEIVEAVDLSSLKMLSGTSSSTGATKTRTGRQLYLDPNLLLHPGYASGLGWEGSKCLTASGTPGVCIRIDSCMQYYRVAPQIKLYAMRAWPQAAVPRANDICSFYDQFGRANSGICCTQIEMNAFGVFPLMPATGAAPAPVPAPPTVEQDQQQHQTSTSSSAEVDGDKAEHSHGFQDINNIDEVKPEAEPAVQPSTQAMPTPVPTYDHSIYQYQWPASFGHFSGLPQWPPPIPTHPPSTGGWPPPIPTHPPNHHYPTHASGGTALTTKRMTTTPRPSTSTTRRPSYPSYPGYPTHRPTAPPTTTTTTKRPSVGASGTSPEGLPLQCGDKNPVSPDQERIVGGTNASPYEFPWIAVLFRSGKQFCGGTLITKNHILTAAHCVARMTSWDVAALTAHLGDYNIRTDFEVQHIERRIKRLVRHKGFDFSILHNDIAILTLNEPVKFTREIQPICLPTSPAQQRRSYSSQIATVAGWGSLRENGPQPSILQKVDIPIWSNSDCARKYGRAAPGGIIESMICAGQANKDSCSGDSGGPMIVNDGGRYTQVGIVSWGIGCGKGQYPGVYTRVTSLLPWIYKNIK